MMSGRGRPPRGSTPQRINSLRGRSPASRSGSPSTRSGGGTFRGSSKNSRGARSFRGSRGRKVVKTRSESPPSTSAAGVKHRRSSDDKRAAKSRRPKFQDNPSAPEIVEKRALCKGSSAPSSSLNGDKYLDMEDHPSDEDEDGIHTANGHKEHADKRKNDDEEDEEDDDDSSKKLKLNDQEASETARDTMQKTGGEVVENSDFDELKSMIEISQVVIDPPESVKSEDSDKSEDDKSGDERCKDEESARSQNDTSIGDDFASNMRKLLQNKIDKEKIALYKEGDDEEEDPLLKNLRYNLNKIRKKAVNGCVSAETSLKSAVSESLSGLGDSPYRSLSDKLSRSIKELFETHFREENEESSGSLVELGISFLRSKLLEDALHPTQVVPLDQIDRGMVPVESVQIQDFSEIADVVVQGEDPIKKRLTFDKSKLFSQMEDKFAKDTHHALKNKPVYKKRGEESEEEDATLSHRGSSSESNNKENENLSPDRFKDTPSPPLLTPETELKGEAKIKEEKTQSLLQSMKTTSPSSSELTKSLRKVRVRSKGSRVSLTGKSPDSQMPEEPPLLEISGRSLQNEIQISPTILSKSDAEIAAAAVTLSIPKPSLKTVIRVPPSTGSTLPSSTPSSSKKKKNHHHHHHHRSKNHHHHQDEEEQDDGHERDLIIDEEPLERSTSSSTSPATTTTPLGGKTSPDSHKSEEKLVPPESMVVPEKASSFNIHPERCCSDMCHYCSLKFGMLDTPLHIYQLKNLEIRKRVEDMTGFEKDACLCDKCFRYLDRKAKSGSTLGNDSCSSASAASSSDKRRRDENSPGSKDEKKSCIVRNCNREVTGSITKKWLIRLKKKLIRKVSLDWERVAKASVKSAFPVCHKHNSWVEFYSLCGLCKKKLNVGGICTLGLNKQEVQELNVLLREDRIPAELVENHFVCKFCRNFCNIKQKAAVSADFFKNQKTQKGLYKEHKKRLYQCLGLETGDSEELHRSSNDSASMSSNGNNKTPKKIHQVSQSDNPTKITIKTTTLPPEEQAPPTSDRPSRKRRGGKEFFSASPSSESCIKVTESSACSVAIQFDLNTKKLWQDLHFPYGNYTAFFRHLILLEKYWRNGDLVLSESANEKSAVYVKSVYNRIRAYEGGRSNVKKSSPSDIDLSASTRPDLSVPAAPPMLHEPYVGDDEDDSRKNKEDPPYKPSPRERQPEILKIPKIPMPGSSRQVITEEEDAPPTKIRVRTDLMHLGLIAKPVPNLMKEPPITTVAAASTDTTTTTSISVPIVPTTMMTATTNTTKKLSPHTISSMLNNGPSRRCTPPPTTSNLVSLLNDQPPMSSSLMTTITTVATTTTTTTTMTMTATMVTPEKPSTQPCNSQLFHKEQSSAIPLTFNNSIAEVLAAANKANKQAAKETAVSMALASKPEITITAKPLQKQPPNHKILPSWQQKQQQNDKVTKPQPSKSRNPIVDMTKLLQTQTPGLPPHLVAQNHLTQSAGVHRPMGPAVKPQVSNRMNKHPSTIAPSGSSSTTTTSSLTNNPLVANQQKKSLNNVLDRLNGMKTSTSSAPPKPHSSSSSLVQQLQAPPQHLPNSPPRMSGPQQQAAAAAAVAAAHQLMWAYNPGTTGSGATGAGSPASTGMVGQPMVQYPDWLNQTQALLMAGALPTLDQVQVAQRAQAFQDLVNLSLGNNKSPLGTSRIRAPPPLTHMGKGSQPKTKND